MSKYNVIIPPKISPYPEKHEISATIILANYFKSDIFFLERLNNLHSPDLKINNILWELKSPKGNSKRTIPNNLREASQQSPNIIIDLRRSKITQQQAVARINEYLNVNKKGINRILLINKSKTVIDFFKNKR